MDKLKVSDMRPYETEVRLVLYSTPVCKAAEELMSIPTGAVLVRETDDSLPTGIITAREILKSIIKNDGDLRRIISEDIMSLDVMAIKSSDSLERAVWKLTDKDPYAVVVMDGDGKYKGYFSPRMYLGAIEKLNLRGIKVPEIRIKKVCVG